MKQPWVYMWSIVFFYFLKTNKTDTIIEKKKGRNVKIGTTKKTKQQVDNKHRQSCPSSLKSKKFKLKIQ